MCVCVCEHVYTVCVCIISVKHGGLYLYWNVYVHFSKAFVIPTIINSYVF